MRTILAIVILLAALLIALSAYAEENAFQLASDTTIHGKGKDGDCMDYAIALSNKLASRGVHGQLIFYRWHIRNTQIQGSHVFVMYKLPDGTEWIVDNEIPQPKQVPVNFSPMQLVFALGNDAAAPVDVELQNGLNHLSYF